MYARPGGFSLQTLHNKYTVTSTGYAFIHIRLFTGCAKKVNPRKHSTSQEL